MNRKEIKYYASLNKKKFRESESLFLVEGKRIVEEGINSNFKAKIIFFTDEFSVHNIKLIENYRKFSARVEKINQQSFNKITDTKNPQGIAAVFHKRNIDLDDFNQKNIIVALESISDPGNIGTILRTCAWFGFEEIIISSDSVDIYNPKVLRSGMGAVFNLKIIQTTEFYSILNNLKSNGYSIVSTDTDGENIFESQLMNKSIITFCNEANGASVKLLEMSDKSLAINKVGSGESLNVATAAAVIISQISKKITASGNKI